MRTDIKKWTRRFADPGAARCARQSHQEDTASTADAVQKVVVRVGAHEASVVDNREIPDISLQHLLAVMLVDKTVTFKSAHDCRA